MILSPRDPCRVEHRRRDFSAGRGKHLVGQYPLWGGSQTPAGTGVRRDGTFALLGDLRPIARAAETRRKFDYPAGVSNGTRRPSGVVRHVGVSAGIPLCRTAV